jgi:hypothetical protein
MKAKKLKGHYQAWVHSDMLVLVVARQGGWTVWAVAEDAQATLGSQEDNWMGKVTTQLKETT